MKYIFQCLDSQNDFEKWMRIHNRDSAILTHSYLYDLEEWLKINKKENSMLAENYLYYFDEDTLQEGERLNLILCPIKWEIEHDCLSEWLSHELYLYYRQLVNGELENVIDPEERQDVVRILTDCFNKVFPEGLEEQGR